METKTTARTEMDRLIAENARLTKALDQAIQWIPNNDRHLVASSGRYPELATELKKHSSND